MFLRVRDLLEQLQRFHVDLARRYRDKGRAAGPLLERVSRHERGLAATVASYRNLGDESVLDTWIQYVPDATAWPKGGELNLREGVSVEEAVQQVLELDAELIRLYERMADTMAPPRVKRFFADLLDSVRQRDRQIGMAHLEAEEQGGEPPDSRP